MQTRSPILNPKPDADGGGDSPRYLTPPDLNACGDRVLVSMEDKTIGAAVPKDKQVGASVRGCVGADVTPGTCTRRHGAHAEAKF